MINQNNNRRSAKPLRRGMVLLLALAVSVIAVLSTGSYAYLHEKTCPVRNTFSVTEHYWTVNYVLGDGATGVVDTDTLTTYVPSAEVMLSTVVPKLEGYTFLGWAESAAGSCLTDTTVTVTPDSANVAAGAGTNQYNVTFYAVWEEVIPESVTLVTGKRMNQAIKNTSSYTSYNEAVTKVVFCDYEDLTGYGVDAGWNDSTVYVDESGNGDARLFCYTDEQTGSETVYICVKDSVDTVYMNPSSTHMFYCMRGLSAVDFEDWQGKLSAEKVTSMRQMFGECAALITLDLTAMNDTDTVTDMSYMFSSCTNLKTLDLSSFDTSHVETMECMFWKSENLQELDLSNFRTSNVTNMKWMFRNCKSLQELDVSNFNTSRVTDMNYMFAYCNSLTELDLSCFDTNAVEDMKYMFGECGAMTALTLSSKFDTSNVKNMESMFYYCASLQAIDLSSFRSDQLENMSSMFEYCKSLKNIEFPAVFTAEKVTQMKRTFARCEMLQEIDLSNFDTGEVTTTEMMFWNCSVIEKIRWPEDPDTSKAVYMNHMFSGCYKLAEMDASKFDTASVINMSSMFANCHSLSEVDVSNYDTGNATNMNMMFHQCRLVTKLDVSSFDTSKVTDMNYMFNNCRAVEEIVFSEKFDTSNVTDMQYMFMACHALEKLDLTSFSTGNVLNMKNMFYGCNKLTTIYADADWDVDQVTNDTEMFYGCNLLVGGEGTPYGSNHIDKAYACLDKAKSKARPGYFTYPDPEVVTLYTGPMLNQMIKNEDTFMVWDTTVTKVVFCDYDELGTYGISAAWEDGTNVDETGMGFARLFRSNDGTTVCICVQDATKKLCLPAEGRAVFLYFEKLADVVWGDKLSMEKAKDISYMFHGSESLTSLDLSGWDTSNVTNMQGVFDDCYNLQTVNLDGWSTGNVVTMNTMFQDCKSLTALDVGHFDTAKVTDMLGMFEDCASLIELDLSSFDTSGVTTMRKMFYNCDRLTTLNVSSFETENVTDMSYLFARCNYLTDVDVSGFDTSSATNMESMFEYTSIKSLDLSSFDTAAVKDMDDMFYHSDELTTIYVSNYWDVGAVMQSSSMFYNCVSLRGGMGTTYASGNPMDITYARVDEGPESMAPGYLTQKTSGGVANTVTLLPGKQMNEKIKELNANVTRIIFCNFDDSIATEWTAGVAVDAFGNGDARIFHADGTVYVCVMPATNSLYLNSDSSAMFKDLTSLQSIIWGSKVTTRTVTNMNGMFSGCTALEILDLSTFSTQKVTDVGNMFQSCSALTTVYVDNGWNMQKVTVSGGMFAGCEKLKGGSETVYAETNANDVTFACVDGGTENPGYLTSIDVAIQIPEEVTLVSGSMLDVAIKGDDHSYMMNSTVTEVIFCDFDQLPSMITASWKDGLPVDDMGVGHARLFRHNSVVYICVKSDTKTVYLNPDSSLTFNLMPGLTRIDFGSKVSTTKVASMNQMFFYCANLSQIKGIETWDTSNVTDMNFMFGNCMALTNLDLSSFNTAKVETMFQMFLSCKSAVTLDLSSFNTGSVTNMGGMFSGCSSLQTILVGDGWNVENVVESSSMFLDCTNLKGGAETGYDANYVNKLRACVDEGPTSANPGYLTHVNGRANTQMLMAFFFAGPVGDNKTSATPVEETPAEESPAEPEQPAEEGDGETPAEESPAEPEQPAEESDGETPAEESPAEPEQPAEEGDGETPIEDDGAQTPEGGEANA